MLCRIGTTFAFNRLGFMFLIICSWLLTIGTSAARSDKNAPIKIGVAVDMTGPLGFAGQGILDGLNAYFAHFNKSGGAHGRSVKLVVHDNKFSADTTLGNIQRLATKEKVHIILGPLKYLPKVIEQAHKMGDALIIPFEPFISEPPSPKFFSLLPSYTTQAVLAVDLIIENLKKGRISVMYEDTGYGREVRSTVEKRLEQYGKKMVADIPFPQGTTDLTPNVMKLIKRKTEAVVVFGTMGEAASVLKTSFNIGGKFQSLVISPLEHHNLLIRAAGRAAEGAIACSIFPDVSYEKAPGIKNFRSILKEYRSEIQPNFYNLIGFTYANVLSEVIRRADSITVEGLTKAFESLKKYVTGILPPISFGSEDRQAYDGAYFSIIKRLKKVLKWLTFKELVLYQVLFRIESVPGGAYVLEETQWGKLGNTGKDGIFTDDRLWTPRTYVIKVRNRIRAKKKNFDVNDDPEFIEWRVNLNSK